MAKRTIVLDVDGVLHSYMSGWKGEEKLPDPPVAGARKAVARLKDLGFEVVAFSTRCGSEAGHAAVVAYLDEHQIPVDSVARSKPPGVLYVDDRGFRFMGDWDALVAFASDARNLEPWNRRDENRMDCGTCGMAFDRGDLKALLFHEHRGLGDLPGLEDVSRGKPVEKPTEEETR